VNGGLWTLCFDVFTLHFMMFWPN